MIISKKIENCIKEDQNNIAIKLLLDQTEEEAIESIDALLPYIMDQVNWLFENPYLYFLHSLLHTKKIRSKPNLMYKICEIQFLYTIHDKYKTSIIDYLKKYNRLNFDILSKLLNSGKFNNPQVGIDDSRILIAIGECKRSNSIPILLDRLSETAKRISDENENKYYDRRIIDACLIGLSNFSNIEIIEKILYIKDIQNGYFRQMFIHCIFNINSKIAIEIIRDLISDSDFYIQRASIKYVTDLRDLKAIPYLIDILLNAEAYIEIKISAAKALAIIKPSDYTRQIIDALVKNNNDDIKGLLAWTLGEIGDKSAIPELEKLKNQQELISWSAQEAINKILKNY